MKTLVAFLALAVLTVFSGCATPESRIRDNPELFAKLTPQEQQMIREGKVGIGFSPEMVRLAVGDPDKVYSRIDANGASESWSYTTYETTSGAYLYTGYYHRYYCYHDPLYPYYLGYPSRVAREYMKVVFTAGKVSSIERET